MRLGICFQQNLPDAGGEDVGFAGARSGHDEHRAIDVLHRYSLCVVETGEFLKKDVVVMLGVEGLRHTVYLMVTNGTVCSA